METPQKDEKPVSSNNMIENKFEALPRYTFSSDISSMMGPKCLIRLWLCDIFVKNFCF